MFAVISNLQNTRFWDHIIIDMVWKLLTFVIQEKQDKKKKELEEKRKREEESLKKRDELLKKKIEEKKK